MAKHANRLREQPAQLRHRLRLATVLGQIHVDEFAQPRRLDQPSLSPQPPQRPFQRLGRGPLRLEAALLHAPRAAPAGSVAVGPEFLPVWAACLQFEDLTDLRHGRSPLSTREFRE
jgi:hypothetical protein